MAHQAAVVSARITADVIESDTLPKLATSHRVTSVPKLVVNDAVERLGSQSEADLLDAIEAAATVC